MLALREFGFEGQIPIKTNIYLEFPELCSKMISWSFTQFIFIFIFIFLLNFISFSFHFIFISFSFHFYLHLHISFSFTFTHFIFIFIYIYTFHFHFHFHFPLHISVWLTISLPVVGSSLFYILPFIFREQNSNFLFKSFFSELVAVCLSLAKCNR